MRQFWRTSHLWSSLWGQLGPLTQLLSFANHNFFSFWQVLLQKCVCSVTQSCPPLCNPMGCAPSSVPGILQARILEWVAISSSRGSSWCRDQAYASCIGRRILYHWATGEAQALQQISKMSETENVSGWSWSSWVHWTPRDKNEARIWNDIISVYHPETLVRPHTYI